MKAEQLRKSILQLAIQGKLVKQDPNDEPASVLLERIRAEKQRLIKEGKIKKDKGDSIIFKGDDNCHYEKIGSEVKNIEDEIDFDLPDGWAFARINSLVYIQTGASFKKEQSTTDSTQTRVLRGGNILQGEYKFFDNDIFIDKQLVAESILLLENDLITPAVTSIENIGKLALIEKSYCNVTAGGFVFIIRPCYNSSIFAKYLLYALQSSYFNKQLKAITKKSGQAFYNLGKERLIQLIVPVPPIKEQERIVNEIPVKLKKETEIWLQEKGITSGYLFLNRFGERITVRGISQQLKNYAYKYGLNPKVVYPHSFRHRFAKNFLEKYNDISLLADLMGHESIETTRIYLRKTASEQQEIVDKIVTW